MASWWDSWQGTDALAARHDPPQFRHRQEPAAPAACQAGVGGVPPAGAGGVSPARWAPAACPRLVPAACPVEAWVRGRPVLLFILQLLPMAKATDSCMAMTLNTEVRRDDIMLRRDDAMYYFLGFLGMLLLLLTMLLLICVLVMRGTSKTKHLKDAGAETNAETDRLRAVGVQQETETEHSKDVGVQDVQIGMTPHGECYHRTAACGGDSAHVAWPH